MFIIFNKDGSIFAKTQSDYVMQGSNRVNKVYIGFVDNNYENLSCNAVFNLPNQTRWTIPAVSVANGFEYLGQTYYGWVISLTDDVTKYSGQVEMTIQVVNATSEVLFTYLANITVNRTGFPLDSYWDNSITVAQFNDYMAQLAVKLQANTVSVVVSENDLQDVGEKNVLYFIIGQESNTPYQVKMWNGSEYTLLGTINLSSFASKEEFKQLQNEVVNPFVVVETVQDLPSTNQDKLYVVIATGKWYYWNGTQYAEGGDFISTGGSDTSEAINVRYDNAGSTLTATNVQEAIDELDYYQVNNYDELTEEIESLQDQIVDLKNAIYGSILSVEPQTYDNVGVAVMDRANGYPIVDNQKSKLESIKGKSLVVNQLVDFRYDTLAGSGVTWAFEDNKAIFTSTNGNRGAIKNVKFVEGHKYLLKCDLTSNATGLFAIRMFSHDYQKTFGETRFNLNANVKQTISYISNSNFTDQEPTTNISFYINEGQYVAGETLTVENVQLVDLTKTFGPGNEPTTIEEFNRLTIGFDFDTYNTGSIESTDITKITTRKKYLSVDLGTLDYDNPLISTDGTVVRVSATIKNMKELCESEVKGKNLTIYKGAISQNSGVNLLSTKTYKNIVYINLPIDKLGWDKTSSIKPFVKTYLSGVILNYEPANITDAEILTEINLTTGELNGIGTAQDEITETELKKVIGVDDLGSLSWQYAGGNIFYAPLSNVKPTDDYTKANILCSIYTTVERSDLTSGTICISGTDIIIQDASCSDIPSLLAKINGVPFYYELATPVITDEGFGEVLFKVQRGGTIETNSNGDITALQVVYKPIQ